MAFNKNKRMIYLIPLSFIIFLTLIAGTSVLASGTLGKGIRYFTHDGGATFFNFDIQYSKLYYWDDYLMIDNLNGVFKSMGFYLQTENANMTITKISIDEIRLTVDAPSETISTTKIYSQQITQPSNVEGCTSWSYNIFTKTITIEVQHNSPAYIIITWGQSGIMPDNILQGTIIQGVIAYYISSIGAVPFYGIIIFGITLLAYIWTQSLEYIAVLWLIIGGSLEIYVPGPGLTIGKVLMVLGIFLILIKFILGKSSYD